MAGMFDDLVPAKTGGRVAFDDLIPATPKRTLVQDVTGAMASVNRGLGIGDELAAGADTLVNLFSGKPASFSDSLAKQRGLENDFAQARPNTAALARGTGMAATAAIPAGGSANLLATSARGVNALRGATTAGLTGAAYSAADAGTPEERLRAASEAARNPLVLGLGAAGGALAPAARKAPKPKISPDVVNLRQRGVQLTPGQAKGGLRRGVEDAATSLPILGTEIQNARSAGLETFVHAVGNEALAPVGLKVPDNIPAGRETVAYVERTLGKLYDDTIPQARVAADPEFKAAVAERIGQIAQDMTPEGRKRLGAILENRVTSRLGGQEVVDGPTFQRIHSELGTVKKRFSGSQDADQRAIADALDAMQEELRNAASRQDPAFAERKAAVDQGYALFKRQQAAAASPGAEGGVFTPAQYGGAVRRGDKSVDKGRFARGDALGQEFADSARAVLPNKVPDSGTATRGMIGAVASAPGALIAGGMSGGPAGVAGVAAGYGATLGGLKLAAKAYTPEAIAAFNTALDGRISRQQQAAALNELKRLAMQDPKLSELYREAVARLTRTAGAIAAPRNAFAEPASSAQ